MKHYRKPAGHYIQLEDSVPVSETLAKVCQRPSANHTFSDNWQSDPMNPLVCWRLKTTAELDAEKEKSALADPVLKMAGAAIIEALFDKIENPTKYPTAGSVKQKALELYKARL